ncbi:MAG: BON domain-containing protein, partial [Candidatus Acidiferrales bacterium]
MRRRFLLPIATLAILLAAGCSKAPNDAAIATSIKAQMFSEAQLKDASLNVVSSKGQVTISGTVSSDAARLDAYKIASQTSGVSKVIDEMVVNAPPAAAAAATAPPAPATAPAPEKRTAANERPHRVHKPKDVEPAPAAEPPADADALAAEQASQQ